MFADHLIDSFLSAQQPRGPFGMFAPNTTASSTLQIQNAGSMAFALPFDFADATFIGAGF